MDHLQTRGKLEDNTFCLSNYLKVPKPIMSCLRATFCLSPDHTHKHSWIYTVWIPGSINDWSSVIPSVIMPPYISNFTEDNFLIFFVFLSVDWKIRYIRAKVTKVYKRAKDHDIADRLMPIIHQIQTSKHIVCFHTHLHKAVYATPKCVRTPSVRVSP